MNEKAPYIALIISTLLGVFGLVFKTKKDKKKTKQIKKASSLISGYINPLTPFGIGVLFLLISFLVIGIFMQVKKDKEIIDKTNKDLISAVRDSAKKVTDSLTASNRYINTIKLLEQQIKNDSNIISKDSIRYYVTLSKLGQQLKKQQEVLNDVQLVMHPLFPMKIYFHFEVDLSTLNTIYKNKFDTLVNDLFNNLSQKHNRYLNAYIEYENTRIIYADEHNLLLSDSIKSNSFEKIELYMQEFIPIIGFRISKPKNMDSNKTGSVVFIISPQENITRFSEFKYYLNVEKLHLSMSYYYEAKPESVDQGSISSILECDSGHFFIALRSLKNGADLSLDNLILKCGVSYHDEYIFEISDKNLVSNKKYKNKNYQKEININSAIH